MRFGNFLVVGAFGVAVAVGCGGSDSNGSVSPGQKACNDICNLCIVKNHSEVTPTDCNNNCTALVNSKPADPVAECQSQINAQGWTDCLSYCGEFANVNTAPQGCTFASDNSDTDCVSVGKPRKINCPDKTHQQSYLAQGCVSEHPDDATETDVCCATTVYAPPDTSGGGSGGDNGGGSGGFVGGNGGFVGTGEVTGAGGFVGGNGGFVGTDAGASAGGFVGLGGSSAGGFVGTGAGPGAGGISGGGTCGDTWLNDCTTSIDCACGFTCVQVCSSCTPNCGRACLSDNDCAGSAVDGLETPYCFRLDQAFQGWCSSSP
ncbi:MAG TPA: hypothetical protein VHE30_10115 [Polyangiaceae bacterium]|nr:hypothetical protein [Polyangiaceae bacterium]